LVAREFLHQNWSPESLNDMATKQWVSSKTFLQSVGREKINCLTLIELETAVMLKIYAEPCFRCFANYNQWPIEEYLGKCRTFTVHNVFHICFYKIKEDQLRIQFITR